MNKLITIAFAAATVACAHTDRATHPRAKTPAPTEEGLHVDRASLEANDADLHRLAEIPDQIDTAVSGFYGDIASIRGALERLESLETESSVTESQVDAMVDAAVHSGRIEIDPHVPVASRLAVERDLQLLSDKVAVVTSGPETVQYLRERVAMLEAEAQQLYGTVQGRTMALRSEPTEPIHPGAGADVIRATDLLVQAEAKAQAAEETLPEALRRAEALAETLGVGFGPPNVPQTDVATAARIGEERQ
jgi:hypothetical protein